MWSDLFVSLFVLYHVGVARAGYPTMGDEVQAGSVLLPASRRGRYLANIVRRQAVDGTGIKFNKDADRMNAEARKKVDVLSEELLPYIIAEQERRVTLYRRVMTAVQNGENGVTVAEIRNKPPVIIRKGLLYRCPTNRAPVEPDGSGAIRCEDNIDPSPIMFDSCLSAEDRELYVAENKFFFCNRHRQEGADLPRNGTAVIGCAPAERTSLNYTSQRCALEDTDDVVVHYRYYPDKTYKFVSELDPEREVCDHWSPCQLGYIFSLPGPDQAAPAIELWHDYDDTDVAAIVADEIVPAVPEDTLDETATLGDKYVTSTRKVEIPEGYSFHGLGFHSFDSNSKKTRLSVLDKVEGRNHLTISYKIVGNVVYITMTFDPLQESDCGLYYTRFQNKNKPDSYNSRDLINIVAGEGGAEGSTSLTESITGEELTSLTDGEGVA